MPYVKPIATKFVPKDGTERWFDPLFMDVVDHIDNERYALLLGKSTLASHEAANAAARTLLAALDPVFVSEHEIDESFITDAAENFVYTAHEESEVNTDEFEDCLLPGFFISYVRYGEWG